MESVRKALTIVLICLSIREFMKAKKVMKVRALPVLVTLKVLNVRVVILVISLINAKSVGKLFILVHNFTSIKKFI